MNSDSFVFLLGRELSGDATPEEQQQLQALLKEDAWMREKYAVFQKMLAQQEKDNQPDVDKALQKVWQTIQYDAAEATTVNTNRNSSRRSLWLRLSGMAAAAILLAGFGWYFTLSHTDHSIAETTDVFLQSPHTHLVEKQNSKGIRSSIVLSDGSKIWLNADSKLDYPVAFEGNTREVYLSGEAFFEVAKNPAHPFIIHLDNGTVRVLGTSFNIKAYKGSNRVETSVATGRVAFIPRQKPAQTNKDTTFLTPDVKAIYSLETGEVTTLNTISSEDKAWTEGKLIFKALTFDAIALELERTFGKKVVFADESIKQYRLTGSFENDSLTDILYYLSMSKPFTYQVTEKRIVIGKQ